MQIKQTSEPDDDTFAPNACAGRFVWVNPVSHTWSGGKLQMELDLTNDSPIVWPGRGPDGVKFSVRWTVLRGERLPVKDPRFPLDAALGPGQTRRIRLVLDVPQHPADMALAIVPERTKVFFPRHGFQNARWRLEVRDSLQVVAGSIAAQTAITRCLGGDLLPIAVDLTNDSSLAWDIIATKDICPRIASRWISLDGKGKPGGDRPDVPRALPEVVEHAETYCWRHDVTAPRTPGLYRLELGLQVPVISLGDLCTMVTPAPFEIEVLDPALFSKEERAAFRSELEAAAQVADAQVHSHRMQAQLAQLPPSAQTSPFDQTFAGDGTLALVGADHTALSPAPFQLVLAPGFVLSAQARTLILDEFAANPHTMALFGDWDVLDPDGLRHSPVVNRPVDILSSREGPGMGPVIALRASVAQKILGKPLPADLDWHLHVELRLLELLEPKAIVHLPAFLAHRIESTDDMLLPVRQKATIEAHLLRSKVAATVHHMAGTGSFHVRYALPRKPPKVAIILPTRDRWELIQPCLARLLDRTDYPNFEVLVIDHETVEPKARRLLDQEAAAGRVRLIPYAGEFNWAAMNNMAVQGTDAQIVCLLNNDTEPVHEHWLSELVGLALQPQLGVVGATLWYSDGKLQHGGVRIGLTRFAGHFEKDASRSDWRANWGAQVRNLSAVTGACMVMRREVYQAVGGMDANYLPIALNDIDFCLKVRERLGLSVVCTPHSELWHYESKSRGQAESEAERDGIMRSTQTFWVRWYDWIQEDPAFSPVIDKLRARPAIKPRATLNGLLRRTQLQESPRLAFIHIPKTAGTALRDALTQGDAASTLVLSPRSLMECYDGVETTLARVRERARQSDLWFSHFRRGLGELLGVPCWHAAVLREPVERIVSHYKHLQDVLSPLHGTHLAGLPLRELLARGVLQGNLMSEMILGGRPEPVTWQQLSAGPRLHNASFCGFGLPKSVWLGRADQDAFEVPGRVEPMAVPDLQEVLDAIETGFAFVGRQDDMLRHGKVLGRLLGLGDVALKQVNVGTAWAEHQVDDLDLEAIQEYAALDLALWDHVCSQDGGYIVREERLEQTRLARWANGDL
jgi:GT2 family glycosyltransferase